MLKFITVLALVFLAAAVRVFPLQSLQSTLAWLTFYPAVMISAVIAGIYGGITAILLACSIVLYGWSYIVSTPFINTHGDWIGLWVFVFNGSMMSIVSEAMRRARYKAKEAQKMAESANIAKSAFLATMSHELRTPLNAILGFSNLMLNDPAVTKEQRDNLNIISRSSDHLLCLINDVLDMAKIEAGKISYESSAFHLINVLNDITSMMKIRAIDKGIQLSTDFSENLPAFVKTDVNKFKQIIINLLGNAIKFTLQGEVSFRVSVQFKNDGHWLNLFIKDSGIGINKEDIQHIFDPFVQVSDLTTQKGTGLGLSLVKQYVKMMGGEISVRSEFGKGSVFTLEIPIQLAKENEVAVALVKHGNKVLGLEKDQQNYRILIVEDQEENWILLKTLLENLGFIVALAENGKRGVDVFKTFNPHLILMDKRMPVMDGIESTIIIRQLHNGKNVKIIAVSASVLADERAEMMNIGIDDFICKPYKPSEIYDVLEKHLGVHFIYEQLNDSNSDENNNEISPDELLHLPATLRQSFAQNLLSGETENIRRLLIEIENINPQLFRKLTFHIDNFNYLLILEMLEKLENTNE